MGSLSAASEPDWRQNLDALAAWWRVTDEWTIAGLFALTLVLLTLAAPFLWPGLVWCFDRATDGVRAASASWRAQLGRIRDDNDEASETAESDPSPGRPTFLARMMALDDGEASTWLLRGFSALAILIGLWVGIRLVPILTHEAPTTNEHGELLAFRVGLAALVGLIGMPLLFIRSWINERQTRTAEQQTRTAQAQLKLAEAGHVTDRIIKATELLGATHEEKWMVKGEAQSTTVPTIEVRLGAIFTLERVARESPEDHLTIMETFAAYVRQNHKAVEVPDDIGAKDEGEGEEGEARTPFEAKRPREDVFAVLKAIARRSNEQRKLEQDPGFQWSDLTLAGSDLRSVFARTEASEPGENLRGAKLQEANLQGANLQGANLQGANLRGAKLQGAKLQWAELQGAKLRGAELRGAKLEGANLVGARLTLAGGVGLINNGAPDASGQGQPSEFLAQGLTQKQINLCFVDVALEPQLKRLNPPLDLPDHAHPVELTDSEEINAAWEDWKKRRPWEDTA